MKKVIQLTIRNIKEMLRDPLSIVFCLIFPMLMLVLMQSIFTNFEYIPVILRLQITHQEYVFLVILSLRCLLGYKLQVIKIHHS